MKKEIAIGACFCIAGMLCTCLFGYEYFTTYGFLNEYHMRAFASAQTEFLPLLAAILWERGKLFFVLLLISLTKIRTVMPLVLRCLLFFTGGVFLAACVMNMGLRGIVFFFAAWIPHGIAYLAAIVLLLCLEPHRFYNRKNPYLKKAAWYLGITVLMLLGCLLEATAGIRLLRLVAGSI